MKNLTWPALGPFIHHLIFDSKPTQPINQTSPVSQEIDEEKIKAQALTALQDIVGSDFEQYQLGSYLSVQPYSNQVNDIIGFRKLIVSNASIEKIKEEYTIVQQRVSSNYLYHTADIQSRRFSAECLYHAYIKHYTSQEIERLEELEAQKQKQKKVANTKQRVANLKETLGIGNFGGFATACRIGIVLSLYVLTLLVLPNLKGDSWYVPLRSLLIILPLIYVAILVMILGGLNNIFIGKFDWYREYHDLPRKNLVHWGISLTSLSLVVVMIGAALAPALNYTQVPIETDAASKTWTSTANFGSWTKNQTSSALTDGRLTIDRVNNKLFALHESSIEIASSSEIELGDLDGDGDLDAYVVNEDQANHVYLNNGNGNFTLHESTTEIDTSTGIKLGDLDGDGDLDAYVVNSRQANRVYLNDGSANFKLHESSIEIASSSDVELGDLDRDGDLDVYVANMSQANQIYLNDGNANFTLHESSAEEDISRDSKLGDLDGDGDLDVYVGNNGVNRVYLNDGSANLTLHVSTTEKDHTYAVDLGDLDGDGDLDVYVGNYNSVDRVYLNGGPANFKLHESTIETTWSMDVKLGDLDRDGDLDVYVAIYGGTNHIYLNNGSGSYTLRKSSAEDGYSSGVDLGDIDGDGGLDAYVTNYGDKPEDSHNLVYTNQSPSSVTYYSAGTATITFDRQSGESTANKYLVKNETLNSQTITYYVRADDSATAPTVPTPANAGTESNWTANGWTKVTFGGNTANLSSFTNTKSRYIHIGVYLATADTAVSPALKSLSLKKNK